MTKQAKIDMSTPGNTGLSLLLPPEYAPIVRAAIPVVATYSKDTDDLLELLDALGIDIHSQDLNFVPASNFLADPVPRIG